MKNIASMDSNDVYPIKTFKFKMLLNSDWIEIPLPLRYAASGFYMHTLQYKILVKQNRRNKLYHTWDKLTVSSSEGVTAKEAREMADSDCCFCSRAFCFFTFSSYLVVTSVITKSLCNSRRYIFQKHDQGYVEVFQKIPRAHN